ncbi:tyrosine-type recombinase/integrase [Streptomyces sp. 184]|uniref:tyrosine-type recombinase/integrase n=1 Tax=Streptomyces sp. 184 TaxID=1827526 RepID=UPI00389299DC
MRLHLPDRGPAGAQHDHDAWKQLLTDAGVCDGRLHDARHTATVLLILGMPERVVVQIMGWSSTAMAARYQHVTGGILGDVAKRVGGLVWDVAQGTDEVGRGSPKRPVETTDGTTNHDEPPGGMPRGVRFAWSGGVRRIRDSNS